VNYIVINIIDILQIVKYTKDNKFAEHVEKEAAARPPKRRKKSKEE